jgi:hypothetical protein
MTQAPEIARPAGGPPPGATGGGPPDLAAVAKRYLDGHSTGTEGRERELALGIQQVINTISDQVPYKHEMNDALVKATLLAIQFAKDQGLMKEYCEKDIEVMRPVNKRMGQLIAATGEKEIVLEGLAGYSPCHYHLVLETHKEPGRRWWKSPFSMVLEISRGIGQFDLTEQYIHDEWFVPRTHGFAETMGVPVEIAPWDDETKIVDIRIKQ